MLMVDLGIGLAEALVRMRAHAFSRDLALIEVAREIIAGTVLPGGSEA
jgi:AmiR/NasT family two-component response regulator